MKELEIAKAERDAMKAWEDEENANAKEENKISNETIKERKDPSPDTAPFVPCESVTPVKSDQARPPSFEAATPVNPF